MSTVAGPPLPVAPLRERRWIPALLVLLVIAGVVGGGYAVADALGEPLGRAIDVGGSVRVSALAGWEVAERFTDPPGVRLTRGAASLDVFEVPFAGSDRELLTVYVTEVLEPDAEQLEVSGSPEPVAFDGGLAGSRIAYIGLFGGVQTPIEGEVTAVVSASGVGVVFDGWAHSGQLGGALDQIRTMVRSAEIA